MCFKTFKSSLSIAKQQKFCHRLEHNMEKRTTCALHFRKRKWGKWDLRKSASILCASKTSRVPRRHHFHQDNAFLHLPVLVRQDLDQSYSSCWMARAGFILCISRSRYLTLCDYFFVNMCERYGVLWAFQHISEQKAKRDQAVASFDQDYVQTVYKTWIFVYALYWEKGIVILE